MSGDRYQQARRDGFETALSLARAIQEAGGAIPRPEDLWDLTIGDFIGRIAAQNGIRFHFEPRRPKTPDQPERDLGVLVVEKPAPLTDEQRASLTDPIYREPGLPRNDPTEITLGEPEMCVLEKPRITDPKKVFSALLLTDAGMKPGSPLEHDAETLLKTVEGWTDDERASAFEWAALSHLRANDNDDVVVPPCPPHVQRTRPSYKAT